MTAPLRHDARDADERSDEGLEGARAPNKRTFMRRFRSALATLPPGVHAALAFALALRLVGLAWGMPASDAWDNDGIAPRDFLPGIAETFTQGHFFTYPPLHLGLLALLTLPITLLAAYRAGSTQIPEVLTEIIKPPYMTGMAMTARVVTMLMSLGIIVALAKIGAELAGGPGASDPRRRDRAAVFTAWVATLNAPFTYYSHTTNLDVPYLFWGSLAALALVRAIARHEPRRLTVFALFAACGVATKDQAYALFLVSAPGALALWFATDPWPRLNTRVLLRDLAVAFGFALLLLLVIDGAVWNPSGFRARLTFLSGSASQDFAQYARGSAGRLRILTDGAMNFTAHYPWPFAVLMAVGFGHALARARTMGRSTFAAAFVPLFVAVSFTLAFNFMARRVEERFTLPQFLFIAVYGGFGLELLWTAKAFAHRRFIVWPLRAACVGLLVLGSHRPIAVDATMLREPRYQTETFLERNVAAGDLIEVHGHNTYLPRLPERASVVRVGPTDPARRGPLPGVRELREPLMNVSQRKPKWIVVSMCYAWRYIERHDGDFTSAPGRRVPQIQAEDAADRDATTFFRGLFGGTLGYHEVDHAFVPWDGFLPRVDMHASLSCDTFVFRRNDALAARADDDR